MGRASRNSILCGGVSRLSRSAVYRKRALYKRKKNAVKAVKAEVEKTKVKPVGGDKNGKERVVPIQKESRFYPTEDVRKPLAYTKIHKPAKLRSSLTPGTVVILLAGRHRGKRVIFLKDMESGLLLVTGPYKVNGVPLRRVPQSYVIATKTKIDVSSVKLPDNLTNEMFKRQKKSKGTSDNMFEESTEGYAPTEDRKAAQQAVDEPIMAEISKEAHLRKYMQQLFSLRKNQFPHEMVF